MLILSKLLIGSILMFIITVIIVLTGLFVAAVILSIISVNAFLKENEMTLLEFVKDCIKGWCE